MSRNIRWDESVRANVLKLVTALLSHADEEFDDAELKTAVRVEWIKENQLRVTGERVKQIPGNRRRIEDVGTTKKSLLKLVRQAGYSFQLNRRKKESSRSQSERELEEVQTVLDCLKRLGVYELENSAKNQGYWKFRLTLKHQTATRDENLEVIERQWRIETEKLDGGEISTATAQQKPIDWLQLCRDLLTEQSLRRQATGYGFGHEIQIFVPLGLVKPKHQLRRPTELPPSERGMQQYQLQGEKEVEKEYQHQEFLEQVIGTDGKNIAIVGEPGAGKTTWVDAIAQYLLRQSKTQSAFPIFIPLANLQGKTLEAYLLQNWLKDAIAQSPDLHEVTPRLQQELVQLFKRDRVWLLLDGVDEIKSSEESKLSLIARSLTGWVKRAQVVLTCRLNLWEANPNTFPDFETYRTRCFNDEQVEEFIGQWFEKAGTLELGILLREKLKEGGKERLRDTVKNPLCLSLLCKIWALEPGDLPETKAMLYQRFRDDVYEWKKGEFSTSWSQRQELNRLLGKLAFRALDKNCPLYESLVYEVLGEEWFELAKDRWLHFVYRDAKTDEPIYAFFHLTFQEYFAALAVEDWQEFLTHVPEDPRQGIYRIFEPQWKEVILLWLGRGDVGKVQKEAFIEALVRDGKYDNLYRARAFFLAAAGIAEFKEYKQAEAVVFGIVGLSFGYFNKERRKWQTLFAPILEEAAREALLQTNFEFAVRALSVLLRSHQCPDDTKIQVAKILGTIDPGNREAIAVLVNLIITIEDDYTRSDAADVLEKIGTGKPKEVAALVNLMATTEKEWIRLGTAISLEKFDTGNPEAIAVLVDIATTKNANIRLNAAEILEKTNTGNPELIAELTNLMGETEDERICRNSAELLGRIDPGNPEAIAMLTHLITTSENKNIRMGAAFGFGYIGTGNQETIAALVTLIGTPEEPWMRWRIADSLGKIDPGNPKAIAELVSIATTEDESTCLTAARILEEIDPGNSEASAMLVNLIATAKSKDVRREAAMSLREIGTGSLKEILTLINLLVTTEDSYTCREAAQSLGAIGEISIGNPEAIATLTHLIATTDNEYIRRSAAYTLGKMDPGNSKAIAVFLNFLATTKDKENCQEAAEILLEIDPGNPKAIAVLTHLIVTTEDEFNRINAARRLENIAQKEQMSFVVSALQNCLTDRIYKTNPDLYETTFKIIWNCAQNLSYPEFYRAWHHLD